MGTFKSFEDLQVWQKARAITRDIYKVSADADFAKDYGLREQVRRASVFTTHDWPGELRLARGCRAFHAENRWRRPR